MTGVGFNPTGGQLLRDGKEVNLQTEQDSDLVMLLKAIILCNNAELSFDRKEWNTQGDTTGCSCSKFCYNISILMGIIY